ncbi:MAG TPA: hypothetical protein DCP90_03330 [Clostridiales bacterium]|nr:MAG: hypothetical protein A2Y22_03065 [Clostridiales bacterium GWD2_32_59]HAN09628.1 hypothetical protein [Clostridiales bacterium]
MEKVELESKKGYKIKCQMSLPVTSEIKSYMIACHGFAADKESSTILELSDKLKQYKISTISFDFMGHGESEVNSEKLSIDSCVDDLETVYDYIISKDANTSISIFASSFGAYVSLICIRKKNKRFENIILRCTAIEMDYIFENELINGSLENMVEVGYTYAGFNNMKVSHGFYNELKEYNIHQIYKNKEICALMIHGDKDDVAPIEHIIKFAEEHREGITLEVIKDAGHRFKNEGESEKVLELTMNYINRNK